MGARTMVSTLRLDYGIKAAEKSVREYLLLTEPEAVLARKRYQWKRKVFWCAGVNDLIVLDQHDKWKRFELYIHAGLDPFSGYIHWLKVWWTNRNPKLIASYYLDAAARQEGIPLLTQSDCGRENNSVANCHTWIRHQLDPSLRDTLQHRWKYKTHNIKSEAFYSYFRRRFSPGFESILDYGIRSNLLDLADPLERLLFRWLAVPWIQRELDVWADRFNRTPRRQDKRKILPCGIPAIIRDKPNMYGAKDYKIIVSPEMLNDARQQWAPPDDPVFELVPPSFQRHVQAIYTTLGRPTVSSATFWTTYARLLEALRTVPDEICVPDEILQEASAFEVEVPILSNLRNIRMGDIPIGESVEKITGLRSAVCDDSEDEVARSLYESGEEMDADEMGLDLREFADFTDSE
ncbi:hypothetical protein EYR36_005016 [Pleurotus pulmonarius]|nr:hypothetical protein EYR36_005016 [Pleurotus pulmonarius]